MLLEAALAVLVPREPIRTFDWAREHATDEWGHPFDDHAFPHHGAPGGVLDAFDCRRYLDIILQHGTRLGKSFAGQVGTLKNADCEPGPMLFAADQRSLALQISGRTRRMLGHIPHLVAQLSGERENKLALDFEFCRVNIGWSRSPSTLADKSCRFGHAAEFDKWVHLKTSKEADPGELWDERFKEFSAYKNIKEGSPGLKQASRLEPLRLRGTNAQLWVPCRKCKKFQRLVKEQILFDKPAAGRLDPDLAKATARYQCPHCKKEHGDEDRGWMMRSGVWVPEGCGVHDKKALAAAQRARVPGRPLWQGFTADADWLMGKSLRDNQIYSSQLSSICALSVSWGQLAEKIVLSEVRPETRRNTINSWWAETFEFAKREQTWESLGKKLIDPTLRRGVVPEWGSLITIAADFQAKDNRYPYAVDAWGPDRRSATIAYGECTSLDELAAEVLARSWPHADGGPPLKCQAALLDSGNRPLGIYEFCDRMRALGVWAWACKGSSTALATDYVRSSLGKNTNRPGTVLVHIDTIRTQDWIERAINHYPADVGGGFALHGGTLEEHRDFLEQLLNEQPVEHLDRNNMGRESWQRIERTIPNDYRDVKRMSFIAMLLATRGGRIFPRDYTPPPPEEPQASRIRPLKFRR